jgi:WD40 repeat protein
VSGSPLPSTPYKGLSPFGDTSIDAALFFGRERDAEIVAANVVASRLTVLYGPSGVGKSSLLAAGVARRLRALPEAPVVVVFSSWSEDPLGALAEALAAEAGCEPVGTLATTAQTACAERGAVYLLLDQLDEFFLYHPDGGTLGSELAALLREAPRVNVLLSLREEALAKLDRFKASIPGILDNYLGLDRLSRGAGRDAIVRPLERWRELGGEPVEAESALVDAVLDQVAAGQISSGLWGRGTVEQEARESRVEAPYLQLVMQRLWEVEREQSSAVLREETLGRLGGARRIVADHLERAMSLLDARQQEIASRLLHQLVTPSGTKIAHARGDLAAYAEAPVGEVGEILDTLASRRILRPGEGETYEIFHDVLAAPILAWRARHDQERALKAAHRRSRRLALVAGLAIGLLALMTLVTIFALVQRSNAKDEAREAQARELDAVAEASLPTDPELSLILARDSAALSPSDTAEDVLRRALLSSRVRIQVDVGAPLLVAAGTRAGIVAATSEGDVVRAARSGPPDSTAGTGEPAVEASTSTTGDVLLTGRDGRLRLVARPGGITIVPKVAGARGAELAPTGGVAAVRAQDRVVNVVDLSTGRTTRSVDHGAEVTATALDAHGKLLATGGADRAVRLWRVSDGRLLHTLEGHVGPITAIAFDPAGTLVGSASTDGLGRVWSADTGESLTVLSGHGNYLTDITFSEDGLTVATASTDRTARTWKADTGAALAVFPGHGDAVVSVDLIGRGGEKLVTASSDGTVRVWDTVVQPVLEPLSELGAPVSSLVFAEDGQTITAVAGDTLYRVDVVDGRAEEEGAAPAPSQTVTGPSGRTARIDGDTVVLSGGGEPTVRLAGHRDDVLSVDFSSDGAWVVTASRDHDARVWDASTGELRHVLQGHFALVSDAAFSPDGRWIATAGPGTAGLWTASDGKLVYYLRGHEGILTSVAFAPDGLLATGGEDGTVRLFRCPVCGGIDERPALAGERLEGTGRELTPDERERYLP